MWIYFWASRRRCQGSCGEGADGDEEGGIRRGKSSPVQKSSPIFRHIEIEHTTSDANNLPSPFPFPGRNTPSLSPRRPAPRGRACTPPAASAPSTSRPRPRRPGPAGPRPSPRRRTPTPAASPGGGGGRRPRRAPRTVRPTGTGRRGRRGGRASWRTA